MPARPLTVSRSLLVTLLMGTIPGVGCGGSDETSGEGGSDAGDEDSTRDDAAGGDTPVDTEDVADAGADGDSVDVATADATDDGWDAHQGDSGDSGADMAHDVATDPPFLPPSTVYEAPGPWVVGARTVRWMDEARGRELAVEIWYPAVESARGDAETGFPVELYEEEGSGRDTLAGLVAAAPEPCTPRVVHAARDATPAEAGAWPTVFFSHCYTCTRWSSGSVAIRLASHGIAVVAPDHPGNTVFDELAGSPLPIDASTLELRVGDMEYVIDRMLDPDEAGVPDALRGRFDATRVGVMGHSFGGATAGKLLTLDDRLLAGVALAVPMASAMFPGVSMAQIAEPTMFLLAQEDNSITEIGNMFIRNNFRDAAEPSWLLEVADAGHFSFSDVALLIPDFDAGCGDGERQTNGRDFTYIDNEIGRGIAGAYATAFFLAHLTGDEDAWQYLLAERPIEYVRNSHKP